MLWLVLILASIVLSAITKVLLQHVLKQEDVICFGFVWNLITGLLAAILMLTEPLQVPTSSTAWLLFFAVVALWSIQAIIGLASFKYTELTLRSPLNMVRVFLVLLLSAAFLNETITETKIVGSMLIVLGAVYITYKKGSLKYLKEKGVQLTLLAAITYSIIMVMDKYNMSNFSPAFYATSMYLLPSIFLGVLTGFRANKFGQLMKRKTVVLATAVTGALYYFLYLHAYKLADASIVFPLYQLNILLAMAIAYLVLGEKTEFKKRLTGAAIMIAGAVIITLGA